MTYRSDTDREAIIASDVPTPRLVALACSAPVSARPGRNELWGRSHAHYSVAVTPLGAAEWLAAQDEATRRHAAAQALALAGYDVDELAALRDRRVPLTRIPGCHVTATDRAGVLAWLQDDREFAGQATLLLDEAGWHPGWYCYTSDGACWVRARDDDSWEAGDSADREMFVARERRAPVRDRIDPAAARPGDTVIYRAGSPAGLLTGQVIEDHGSTLVTVDRAGRCWGISWLQVTHHTPRESG